MVRRLLWEGVLRWWCGLMLWVEMVCFVFYLGSRVRGNDVRRRGNDG